MTQILLIHSPGACSRVTMTALEQIGIAFRTLPNHFVMANDDPAIRALNPTGMTPTLHIGDHCLNENAAILHHLAMLHPQAGLLPRASGAPGDNRALQDLVWCSSTLHPATRMLRAPARFTTDGNLDGIRARGFEYWAGITAQLSARFGRSTWWYGADWSIVDTYLFWTYSTAQSAGLDLSGHPEILRHADTVQAQPAFQRARMRELADREQYELALLPGVSL